MSAKDFYKEQREAEEQELLKTIEQVKDIVKDSETLQAGIDNYDFYYYQMKGIRRKSDIFPLKKMKFEDTEFWAPNNHHEYLKTIFNFYSKLPMDISFERHKVD